MGLRDIYSMIWIHMKFLFLEMLLSMKIIFHCILHNLIIQNMNHQNIIYIIRLLMIMLICHCHPLMLLPFMIPYHYLLWMKPNLTLPLQTVMTLHLNMFLIPSLLSGLPQMAPTLLQFLLPFLLLPNPALPLLENST